MAVLNEQPTIGVIRLGSKELSVVPQKHARLRRYLRYEDFQKILSKEYSENSYQLLCILIPAMDPKNPESTEKTKVEEWEFDGFPTKERWEDYKSGNQDAYDEYADPGPTTDEIAIAFETALKVNGAGRLGKIVTLVQGATRIVEATEATQKEAVSSSMLPGASGESPSENSGTSPQTPS